MEEVDETTRFFKMNQNEQKIVAPDETNRSIKAKGSS